MATTLRELAGMLDNMGVKYDMNDERIYFGSKDDDQIYLFIRLPEDGELLSITVQIDDPNGNYLAIPFDHQYIKEVMAYLLSESYKYKIGTWVYDPSDGDVRFKVSHSIESNDLTEDQFKRLIGVARHTGDSGAVAIRKILETGEATSKEAESSSDAIGQALTKKAAELIAEGKIAEAQKLLQLIAEGKQLEALQYLSGLSSEGI